MGAQRAKDGHPAPVQTPHHRDRQREFFDRSRTYDARYAQFSDAIKKKYPQIECISAVGFEQPDRLRVHSRKPDLVDEHYYRSVDEFLKMSPNIYEKYDRNGPKIFRGRVGGLRDAIRALGQTLHKRAADAEFQGPR